MSDRESTGAPIIPTPASPDSAPAPSPAPVAYPVPPAGYPAYPAAGASGPAGSGYPPPYAYPDEFSPVPAYTPVTYPEAPPGHLGYPGAWPPPGPPPRSRLGLVIGIVVAIVVLLAGGVAITLLVSAANSPRTSLEGWFEAARSGDTTALRSLTCAQYAHMDFDPALLAGLTWEIHEIRRVDETLAEATVTVQAAGEVAVERWAIVHEDGGWKVCGPVDQLERV